MSFPFKTAVNDVARLREMALSIARRTGPDITEANVAYWLERASDQEWAVIAGFAGVAKVTRETKDLVLREFNKV